LYSCGISWTTFFAIFGLAAHSDFLAAALSFAACFLSALGSLPVGFFLGWVRSTSAPEFLAINWSIS
jgi:hypothetical protein